MLLSISDACRVLGINPQTLRRWEKEGKIKCVWTEGGQRRIAREEIAQIMGCFPDEIEIRPKDEEHIDLKKKKREAEALKLELKKEKTAKALSRIKGDSVKKARDELEILRINHAKELLLEDKKRAENEKKKQAFRQAWINAWIEYAYKCLDPIPHVFPNFMTEHEEIPFELKVKTQKAVKEFLNSIDTAGDIDPLRLQIERIADDIRSDYYRPKWKSQLIEHSLSWLDKSWPLWIDNKTASALMESFRKVLKRSLSGCEDYEEVDKSVEELRNEVLSVLKDIEPSQRMIIIDQLFASSAMCNFDQL